MVTCLCALSLQRLRPRLPVFPPVCRRLLEAIRDVITNLRTVLLDPQGRSVGLEVEHGRVLEHGQYLLQWDAGRVLGRVKGDPTEEDESGPPWKMISILAVQT